MWNRRRIDLLRISKPRSFAGIGIADSIRSRETTSLASDNGAVSATSGLERMLRQADLARAGAMRDNIAE